MKRDYDLARKYYRLGVLESDAYCYCQLGVMYALGQGVKKDAHIICRRQKWEMRCAIAMSRGYTKAVNWANLIYRRQ